MAPREFDNSRKNASTRTAGAEALECWPSLTKSTVANEIQFAFPAQAA